MVICDIAMDHINGYEFVTKVKNINPKVKVALMTSFEIRDSEFSNVSPYLKIDGFIKKPFSPSVIRNILTPRWSKRVTNQHKTKNINSINNNTLHN